ncbi:hypothetical protein BHE74_00050778 [Ensete ventricosum]|nr:hypothetical protein BHE74_00050778 [Ensete ventricosum]RZR98701.1 hypothetical protein BHM03_00028114 [Ensete ventricosum]
MEKSCPRAAGVSCRTSMYRAVWALPLGKENLGQYDTYRSILVYQYMFNDMPHSADGPPQMIPTLRGLPFSSSSSCCRTIFASSTAARRAPRRAPNSADTRLLDTRLEHPRLGEEPHAALRSDILEPAGVFMRRRDAASKKPRSRRQGRDREAINGRRRFSRRST